MDAQIDFRYCKMGRIDRCRKNYRSNGAKTHEVGAAGNPFRQIRARIYSGNEYGPSAVRELATPSRKASDRKSRCATSWTDGLENKNKKHLAALSRRQRTLVANSVLPQLILFGCRVPENQHRARGGRNRAEPLTRHKNSGG